MRTPLERSKLLDRGGKPTVRELLSSVVFNPVDGTIRLNGERIVMQRAAVGTELRRELTALLGPQEARVFLIRLGFISGRADARFVRTRWPNLEVGDAFTAGERLHTFSGVVRVETIFNEYDFRKKRFSAEFLWHDSSEAEEFRRHHRQTTEPVCWTQLGYACGYASEFFDTLIIYKEVECSAEGHKHCRVIGKPADVWGPGDPEVIMFRERIAASLDDGQFEPRRALTVRTAGAALSDLDRIVLAPVREKLDRFAPMALPVLIEGAAGTGRSRAARYLHRVSNPAAAALRRIRGAQVTHETCAEISRSARGGRRGPATETLLIEEAQSVPAEVQETLAHAIEEALLVGGPRVIAIVASGEPTKEPPLNSSLYYALSTLTVRTPSLAQRPPADRLAIANALLSVLSTRMRLAQPELDASASSVIERADWPGNVQQMRSVLGATLAARRNEGPISGKEIETQLDRSRSIAGTSAMENAGLEPWIDRALSEGNLSMAELENRIYRAAVARSDGNLSAAARLVGLTRAQLAYRLGTRTAIGDAPQG